MRNLSFTNERLLTMICLKDLVFGDLESGLTVKFTMVMRQTFFLTLPFYNDKESRIVNFVI
jgi:hypothetical protein